jgi:serine/threonine protein kinase
MGAIIKGRDTDLGRDLAIKVLLDQHKDKPAVVQRFIEEAQIGGQLQHPGIVPIYELGQFADQRPFFSMKLVKGETLSKLLAARVEPAADRGKFLGIFEQVCQTMAYAHSRGVIHRDLKPANIMVGAFGEVQVMDWGLAKVLESGGIADEKTAQDRQKGHSIIQTLRSQVGSDMPDTVGSYGSYGSAGSHTQMGSVMGTPAYMPPEQALGEIDIMDERADVFGLGAILAEILTGQPPYVGDDGTQVFRMASRGKLTDCFARLDASGVDADLIALTKHCLELEPQDRPRNAGELAQRITGYLESVETKLRETELERATQAARAHAESERAHAESARAEAEAKQADAERQRAESESQRARSQSQAARRLRIIVASLALVAVLSGITAVQFRRFGEQQREMTEKQNQVRAAALVDGLLGAEIGRIPAILEQLDPFRSWVDPLLAARRREHLEDLSVQRRLAMAFREPQDVATLEQWLLAVEDVDDMSVIRNVLGSRREQVAPSLWKVALDVQQPAAMRFRAACALAAYDPDHENWQHIGPFAAEQLLEQPLLLLDKWATLLQPVHGELLDRVAVAFRDATLEQRARRDKATIVLAKQFRKEPDVLVDLLCDADATQFETVLAPLQQDHDRAVALLETAISESAQPATQAMDDTQPSSSLAQEAAAIMQNLSAENRSQLSQAELARVGDPPTMAGVEEIGRASCRERVCLQV